MFKLLTFFCCVTATYSGWSQSLHFTKEKADRQYVEFKNQLIEKLKNTAPGKFSDHLPGIIHTLNTNEKNIALTFDACGGTNGSGFDEELIAFLIKENIPATLFITGTWIQKNTAAFQTLCRQPLFRIENHGLTHHPCALGKESKYGIKGTDGLGEAIDEVELNARIIESYTNRRPVYYRPATAYTDEGCMTLVKELNQEVAGYSVLSGDAVAGTPAENIKQNILRGAKSGSIVIMHMNHPTWNTLEALQMAIPVLRKDGYRFVYMKSQ
ncbi:MAG: polysaccharide deacetylase family protein [Bacteroidetes bacterium]|nr:polysaccharide deacetylase family protein [Bacteroidota bacterium]MBS1539828.1 polysaccharide deacetylase family protein [Bacteroidota bacterium]